MRNRLTEAQLRALAHAARTSSAIDADILRAVSATAEAVRSVRTSIGERRDTLKWLAGFDTAGLIAVYSALHEPAPSREFLPLSQAWGLSVGALLFLASVLCVALFLTLVDDPMATWVGDVAQWVGRANNAYSAKSNAIARLENALTGFGSPHAGTALTIGNEAANEVEAAMRAIDSLRISPPSPRIGTSNRLVPPIAWGTFLAALAAIVGDVAAKMSP